VFLTKIFLIPFVRAAFALFPCAVCVYFQRKEFLGMMEFLLPSLAQFSKCSCFLFQIVGGLFFFFAIMRKFML